MFAWDPSSLLKCSGSSYVAYTCHTILEVRSLLNVMFPYILVGNSWCSSNTLVVWSHDLVVVDPNRRFCTRGRSREDDSVLLFTASPLLVLCLVGLDLFFSISHGDIAIFFIYVTWCMKAIRRNREESEGSICTRASRQRQQYRSFPTTRTCYCFIGHNNFFFSEFHFKYVRLPGFV